MVQINNMFMFGRFWKVFVNYVYEYRLSNIHKQYAGCLIYNLPHNWDIRK